MWKDFSLTLALMLSRQDKEWILIPTLILDKTLVYGWSAPDAVTAVRNTMHSNPCHNWTGWAGRTGWARYSRPAGCCSPRAGGTAAAFLFNILGMHSTCDYHPTLLLLSRQTHTTAAPHCHSILAVLHSYWRHPTVLVCWDKDGSAPKFINPLQQILSHKN